ncbi:hypothetical protein CCC_00751 [Paramagnetospirillum magnetotacticum MS-1]|uniref:Death on curing protein Doc toxin n=1 Tax=Paramagnetospirillum magnetotacticum MS-1 TaxID=272627 RepID=A0A0C2YSJ5_PARME|nr:type II toxin-antitoxin system RelE/ParE family toxin [Paramagnetospirillum magnetotacticum]KIL97690.1 hypothetical protein CCC_00751 [Paramagnetospirillum magnetotacticum MS-1]
MTSRRLAILSPEASAWYLAEIAYLAERNALAAEKVARRIRAARKTLAEHPNIGPPGLIPGTRRMVVGSYVLTVRLKGGAPEIIDIRHGRQADGKE